MGQERCERRRGTPAAPYLALEPTAYSLRSCVAAKLGVADLLAGGSRPVEALAAATQTDALSLRRVLRALAIMYAEEQYRAWGDILHSVQTGETAFEKQFGTSYFAYLAQHPEVDRVFNEAMAGYTTQLVGAVVDAYDFSPFQTIVDVGGSYGTLLAAMLRSHPAHEGSCSTNPM